MSQKNKIGFIGAGNMANAVISGLLANGVTDAGNIYVYDIDAEKCAPLAEKGISVCADSAEVVNSARYTVLAVKPQNYVQVLSEIRPAVSESSVLVSIAAGISTEFITNQLGRKTAVVRAMPNTPMLLGRGASAICRGADTSEEDFAFVKRMFELGGTVEELPESLMNTVIAVNGSSPAYIYLFAKAMTDYAVENGIPADKALNLVCAALEGSAAMLRESGDSPDALIQKVCSPGGTTIEAVNTLKDLSFYDAVKKAMENCTRRAEELGK